MAATFNSKYGVALLVALFPPGVVFLSVTADIAQFEGKSPFSLNNGVIAKLDCANHGHYLVAYDIDNHSYTQSAGNLFLNGSCKSLKIHQSVDIWVSKKDSNYVSFVPPDFASKSMASDRRAALFLYPIFALFTLAAARFRKTRTPT
jgi:hypothetical protein